jgi:hypothetical protein
MKVQLWDPTQRDPASECEEKARATAKAESENKRITSSETNTAPTLESLRQLVAVI